MSHFNRRTFLQSSSLIVGGTSLANLLRLRAEANPDSSNNSNRSTSVIFITLGGGPTQFETFDPKPDAPIEYRGEFQAIQTKIPGVQFCELLPQLSSIADRIAVIRSVHHEQASHIAEHIVETGYDLVNSASSRTGDKPSIGAIVSKCRGVGASGIPAYVSIPRHHAYSSPQWVGAQHHFFPIDANPNDPDFAVHNLALIAPLTANRLRERRHLQSRFGEKLPLTDRSGDAAAIDQFSQQAFDLVTGERAQRAFNIRSEDPRVRDRYGRNDFRPTPAIGSTPGGSQCSFYYGPHIRLGRSR